MNITRKHITIAIAFAYIIVFVRIIQVSMFDEGRARNQIFGDGYSDINTISSAWYFLDSGFTQTSFLPVHEYFTMSGMPIVYTHYPALPNIIAGIVATLTQSRSEEVMRIFPLLLSSLLLVMMYKVLHRIFANNLLANGAFLLLVLSNYFIAWADNLHQHLYGELLKWVSIWLLLDYFTQPEKRIKSLWLLYAVMLLQVNISFEQAVFLGAMSAAASWFYQRSLFNYLTIGLFLSLVVGFMLHFMQNVIHFQSWQVAFDDMFGVLKYRTTGSAEGVHTGSEATYKTWEMIKLPIVWLNRMERFYLLPGWFVLVLYIYFFKPTHQQQAISKMIWILFIASVSWSLVMPQHAYIHNFTGKHFAVWYAVVATLAVYQYALFLKNRFNTLPIYYKVFNVLLVLYAFGMFLTQHVYELYLKFGLLYPMFGYY
jgi:hypothetical protein